MDDYWMTEGGIYRGLLGDRGAYIEDNWMTEGGIYRGLQDGI